MIESGLNLGRKIQNARGTSQRQIQHPVLPENISIAFAQGCTTYHNIARTESFYLPCVFAGVRKFEVTAMNAKNSSIIPGDWVVVTSKNRGIMSQPWLCSTTCSQRKTSFHRGDVEDCMVGLNVGSQTVQVNLDAPRYSTRSAKSSTLFSGKPKRFCTWISQGRTDSGEN